MQSPLGVLYSSNLPTLHGHGAGWDSWDYPEKRVHTSPAEHVAGRGQNEALHLVHSALPSPRPCDAKLGLHLEHKLPPNFPMVHIVHGSGDLMEQDSQFCPFLVSQGTQTQNSGMFEWEGFNNTSAGLGVVLWLLVSSMVCLLDWKATEQSGNTWKTLGTETGFQMKAPGKMNSKEKHHTGGIWCSRRKVLGKRKAQFQRLNKLWRPMGNRSH